VAADFQAAAEKRAAIGESNGLLENRRPDRDETRRLDPLTTRLAVAPLAVLALRSGLATPALLRKDRRNRLRR
jgi:hypothetical protein